MLNYGIIYNTLKGVITLQTAACITASKPPSGASILAEIFCSFTISLNLWALFVNGKTCLYPKVGKQSRGTLLKIYMIDIYVFRDRTHPLYTCVL